MDLDDLGWTRALQAELDALPEKGLVPGRVVDHRGPACRLLTAEGERLASFGGRLRRLGDAVAIGDWVAAKPGPDRSSIRKVLARRTVLARKAAGEKAEAQVLAANVDVAFLVSSVNRDWNPRRLERLLAMAWDGGVQPVVLLNKCDQVEDPSAFVAEAERAAPGAPVYAVSAVRGDGLAALAGWLEPGKTAVLLGSSGVGKSSLINRLLGRTAQAVREIREDERGRHTTTHRQLFVLESGALIIDTPGIREVGLWEAELDQAFPEIDALVHLCRFTDCRHEDEPGCVVLQAVRDGSVDAARLENYRKLRREKAALLRKEDVWAAAKAKREDKIRTKAANRHVKEKRKDP